MKNINEYILESTKTRDLKRLNSLLSEFSNHKEYGDYKLYEIVHAAYKKFNKDIILINLPGYTFKGPANQINKELNKLWGEIRFNPWESTTLFYEFNNDEDNKPAKSLPSPSNTYIIDDVEIKNNLPTINLLKGNTPNLMT